jgi:glutathione S-transferase
VRLYSNPVSPFARKARVIIHELSLPVEIVNIDARDDENYRRVNPLKLVPALVLDDSSVLIDSPVICEYLNQLGGGKFFPGMSIWRNHTGRWKALGLQALADGVMDAAVAWRYELVEPEERRNPNHVARRQAAVKAGLDAFERMNFARLPTIGEIAAGCALGYIDFRHGGLDWRSTRPKLAAWYEGFSQYPSMKATAPQ